VKRILGWLVLLTVVTGTPPAAWTARNAGPAPEKVFIIPIREDISAPLAYLVRRGVKAAMDAQADVLVLDMDTNGGLVSVTEEIIEILGQFKGRTVTYVNRKAFSAGAFIAFATQKIYMAPQSVIGAAAPILLAPGGSGVQGMDPTLEAKTVSAISALVRANAEKNGHNVDVADAMVKKTKELVIDGKTLNEKGQILTLTNKEAEQEYGDPPRPLLSLGTVESLEDLLKIIAPGGAQVTRIEPTGAEQFAFWLNAISPLLLIIGAIGIYIEFKTPGFGLPGIIGVIAFALYFLGGYVAGLSGLEWLALFALGLALVALELFVFPGTVIVGLAGAVLILITIIMAMVDYYPGTPKMPTLPQLRLPLMNLLIATIGGGVLIWVLSRVLPRTPVYSRLVSQSASGVASVQSRQQRQAARLGQVGVTVSPLHPGGKVQFGDEIVDVVTQGEMLPKGVTVRVIGTSAGDPVVEAVS
jgi:membrane-bound serine protease (ClpP class)